MKKIFISHSQKDKKLAKKFKELLEGFPGRLKLEVFLSSNITSDQIKSKQWKENFEKNLKECTQVVVIVTPNSLNSKWVQYETGYASASGIEITPIGIKGVSPEDFFLNAYSMQIVKEKSDIIKLLSSIFKMEEEIIDPLCERKEKTIKELLDLCKERCVYFVGSKTNEGEWRQVFVKSFLEGVTNKLLKKGIKVSSFPSVDEVGKIVCKAAMASHSELYEISGLYQFDKIPEYENGKTVDPVMWKKTIDGYRRLYLKNKSSMIIIGGGVHTEEEYDVVAEDFKNIIEVFPIPCMGGFGEELFLRLKKDEEKCRKYNHPCFYCEDYKNKNRLRCEQIELFVKRLDQYNYVNDEEERES